MQVDDSSADAFTQALEPRMQELKEKLNEGDVDAVTEVIQEVNATRDSTLYQEVGRLTRGLHDALQNFHLEMGQGFADVQNELSEMVDARSRLDYVIRLTEEAANNTMDRVDESLPVAQNLAEQAKNLASDWDAYKSETSNPALHGRITTLLEDTASGHSLLQEKLNEIMVAQGFQDLSGQVIKRVIALVNEVEENLVRLVRLAGSVEAAAGIETASSQKAVASDEEKIRAEGPQTNKKAAGSGVVSGQDDVDDLLSSLGF